MLISGIVNPKSWPHYLYQKNQMKVTDYMELSTPAIQGLDFVLEAENKRKENKFSSSIVIEN